MPAEDVIVPVVIPAALDRLPRMSAADPLPPRCDLPNTLQRNVLPRPAGAERSVMSKYHPEYIDPTKLSQHPLAAHLLPPATEEEVEALADAMRRHGFDPAYPLKLSQDYKLVLDGEIRRRAAVSA